MYLFCVPIIERTYFESGQWWGHNAPYRQTGIQKVEWYAIKLLRLLKKDKNVTNIKWIESLYLHDHLKIIVSFNIMR